METASGRPETAVLLDLAPHPEGGWYRETWRAGPESEPDGYPGPRSAATVIYFLLLPGEESRWHRVRSDEVWLWHSGGPLMLLDGGTGDQPAAIAAEEAGAVTVAKQAGAESEAPAGGARSVLLGPDLAVGQVPQHVIPGGHWQAARPAADAEVLVSCVVAPGFDFADFEFLSPDEE
jgi:predicted cupin superfamily sugar epimerase